MIPEIVFITVQAISCPSIKVVNKSSTWNDQDRKALATATSRCKSLYTDSPCLKTFKKVEDGIYNALCGKGVKSEKIRQT